MLPIKRRRPPKPVTLVRRKQSRARKVTESENKLAVRRRDRFCRFPLCPCHWRGRGAALHVSHQQHKGMGGNPFGDRSTPERMLLVCANRHRESRVSIDRGTLRWTALREADGAAGPIRWEVDVAAFSRRMTASLWVEVAREYDVQCWEPYAPEQLELLEQIQELDR